MDNITQIKKNIIRRLKNHIKPLLRDSGYVANGRVSASHRWWPNKRKGKSFQLCCWNDNENRIISSGIVIESVLGFCTNGVIIDASAGGLVWVDWKQCPMEDLLLVEKMLKTMKKDLS